MSYDPNLPFCCIECAQLYTIAYYQQSLETFLLSHNDNLSEELEDNTNVEPIAPISLKGSSKTSKSVNRGPRHTIPETKHLNVSRNNRDPFTALVPARSPRNPKNSAEREPENGFGIENDPLTSSVPAQDRSPSNRAHNHRNTRETGVSISVSKPRKHNDDLPPIPTQDTNSSNSGPQLQYPQESPQGSYSVDKPLAHSGPLSVRTDEQNQSNYAQIRPQTQQPRKTRVSFSANNPRDSDHVEPPSVPIQSYFSQTHSQSQETQASNKPRDHIEPPSVPSQEKSQSNFSQTQTQTQETQASNKPQDHIEPPSVPIQEKSQSNFSQTRYQPQEIQTSSDVNKSRDSEERHKASIPTQDQGQDRSASDASKTDTRPHLMHGTPSQMDTQYVNMLLALDDIPKLHNMLAKFFNWILLAGFLLFPGTFTSLKNLGGSGQVEEQLVHAVTSIPLFVVAWLCTGVGATGMLWLWWRWRLNYLWALNQIFMPGAMNSLAGFISTMANVYGAQHGELSTTSKVTIIVTAVSTGVLGILTAIYSFWLVRRIKSQHDRRVGKQRTGKHGEGVVDLSKRQDNV